MDKIVFDIETKNTFSDVGGKNNIEKLEVSVVGVYSYKRDEYICFDEDQMDELGNMLREAKPLIGFYSKGFDVPVLDKYFKFKLSAVPQFDILEEIKKITGNWVRLDVLAEENLGKTKNASSGLKAVQMYKDGNIEELKNYCLQDVRITKEIFDIILSDNVLKVPRKNSSQVDEVKVNFEEEKDPQDTLI